MELKSAFESEGRLRPSLGGRKRANNSDDNDDGECNDGGIKRVGRSNAHSGAYGRHRH